MSTTLLPSGTSRLRLSPRRRGRAPASVSLPQPDSPDRDEVGDPTEVSRLFQVGVRGRRTATAPSRDSAAIATSALGRVSISTPTLVPRRTPTSIRPRTTLSIRRLTARRCTRPSKSRNAAVGSRVGLLGDDAAQRDRVWLLICLRRINWQRGPSPRPCDAHFELFAATTASAAPLGDRHRKFRCLRAEHQARGQRHARGIYRLRLNVFHQG